MRIITSTSAAARLEAARAFLGATSSCHANGSSSARRAARPTISRARSRGERGATFGITRFSLTELAARAAAAHPGGARRVPGTQAGAEAIAARAVFDALARRRARVLRAGRAHARISRRRWRGRCTNCASPASAPRTALRRRPRTGRRTSNATRRSAAACSTRVEAELDRSSVDDRAALFRARRRVVPRGHVRWARMPILLLDVPLDSRAEQEFVAALIARSPDVLATVPDGDTLRARRASRPSADDVEETSDCRLQQSEIAIRISPVCGGTCFRPSGRPRASAPATSCCFRRRAKGARRWRSSAGCSTRPAAACRSTRWPCSCARRSSISACSSTRARAAACRCTSIAAPAAPIPPAARSSRCCRARSTDCRPSDSTSTCRSARCRRSREHGGRAVDRRAADEVFADRRRDESPARR